MKAYEFRELAASGQIVLLMPEARQAPQEHDEKPLGKMDAAVIAIIACVVGLFIFSTLAAAAAIDCPGV